MTAIEDRSETEHLNTAADPAPATERTLPGQRVDCHLAAETFTVRITNRDRIAWEKTAPRHKWGTMQDSPNLAMAFLTWSAAKRDGQTVLTFDEWSAALEDYDIRDDDAVRPTR